MLKYFYIILLLTIPFTLSAQEEAASVYHGRRYIDFRLKAIEKFNKKTERQQTKLLNKLSRKEKKFARNLKRKDSAAHARYQQQQPSSFASIKKQNKPDSATLHGKTVRRNNGTIDSLQNVGKFVENKKKALEDKAHVVGESKGNKSPAGDYNAKLQEQKAKLSYRKHISEQINNRTKAIKGINASVKGGVKGAKSIDKNVFYSNAKIGSLKQVMEDPSAAEEKAFEYLQGQEGFDQYLQGDNGMASLNGMSNSQLEKMGYQTKQQVTGNLQKKFGGNLSGLQQSMGQQVSQFQDKTKKLHDAKNKAKQAKHSAKNAKHSARNLKASARIDKPGFKVNPMRGKPFAQRIEKQINWQTTRATLSGNPATFQLSLMAGFRHTERLTYGIGVAPAIGLGTGWNDIHFSFEGIGLRSYATWELFYGFGAYAGYERMYKKAFFLDAKEVSPLPPKPHNQPTYNESLLIGLTKKYRLTDQWSGGIQLLFDFWWKDKGLRSPLQLRFTSSKN